MWQLPQPRLLGMQGWEGWEKWEEGTPPPQTAWCRGRGRNFGAIYTDVVREGGWQCGWISSGYKQTCFSFKDPGVPVTRSLFPIFQGAGKATIEIGMLGDQNGFFSRNPASPSPNGGNFLKVGRAEASRKTMKFSGQLPPENLGGYGHKKFFLQNK